MIPCTKIFKGVRSIHNSRVTGPLFVWNITEQCNLRCGHCYRGSGEKPETSNQKPEKEKKNRRPDLSDVKCIQLIDEIKELNSPIVLLTGGEPLLRKNIFDIVRRCKESGLRVGISTNGTLIDGDMARKIKDSGADYVGVSIDGQEGINDRFRGLKGAYRLSWSAIEMLNSLGVKTGVRFTIADLNKNDLLDVLYKAFNSGVKRFCLYHLVYSGRGKDLKDVVLREKRDIMDKFFDAARRLSLKDGNFEVLTTDNPADGVYMMAGALVDSEAAYSCIRSQGGCSAGDRVVYLDSDGTVYPCQFLRDEPLGNVCERRFSDIWSDTYNELLNMMRDKDKFLTGRCGACAHKSICGGCRARAKAVSGSLWSEDPACYLEDREISVSGKPERRMTNDK